MVTIVARGSQDRHWDTMTFDKSQRMILALSFVSPPIAAMFAADANSYRSWELGGGVTSTIPRAVRSRHIKEESSVCVSLIDTLSAC